jgi:hypothetical protein
MIKLALVIALAGGVNNLPVNQFFGGSEWTCYIRNNKNKTCQVYYHQTLKNFYRCRRVDIIVNKKKDTITRCTVVSPEKVFDTLGE